MLCMEPGHCGMSLCIMEQACEIFSKFLNCGAVQYIVSGIWFRVLFVFCMVCGCCRGVSVCCKVFLDVLYHVVNLSAIT